MGLFKNQLASVIEWKERWEDAIFWKWHQSEIKKDSRLIIRPGQDAIFLYNGRIEGVFKDEGNYEISSQIVPFLSSLKGFKFGFNSGLRAEVLFVNTKEFLIRWGTRNAILLPAAGLVGGLPIRCYGTLSMKVTDYIALIDQIAGIRDVYTVEDVQERITNMLDSYLMKWISAEGKDMFNLQVNSAEIAKGIKTDLDMEMQKLGIGITAFHIASFTYPPEIQEKINQAASVSMVGNVDQYQRVKMVDSLEKGGNGRSTAGDTASAMMGMAMGMQAAQQFMNGQNNTNAGSAGNNAASGGKRFCSECGAKLEEGVKFCSNCGSKI